MLKKILLPTILGILSYGFWISPDFKVISAGVSIFLFGMLSLEQGFKAFSGGTLEKILQNSTDKLYKSVGFGILTTTIMQSSSLVSVLTISFLGAGLIGLAQGIGIVFGANIGTTTGAWLVAGLGLKVKISAYAMPMLVFGVILIFQKSKSLKGLGYVLAGLGFLFLGIHYMKDGFEAFKDTIDLASYAVTGYKGLFIFTGIGVFATVIMQSSHATLVLIITALAAGQISYENALALAIGANIGTTITAILGAMSSNIVGKQLAGAHLIFNGVTGLIAIVFIHQLMYSVDSISAYIGIANDDYTLKLAVFHTIFNVIGVLVMVPFINKLVTFLESVLNEETSKSDLGFDHAKYLNDSVLELPSTSMAAIIRETKHLYENAFEIITHGLNLKRSNIVSSIPLEVVVKDVYSTSPINIDDFYNHKIKGIYGEIIDFSTRAQADMSPKDIEVLYKLKLANRDLVEAVKDTKHLQKNLIKYANSTNTHIKEQYDLIRRDLAELLRNINIVSTTEEEDVTLVLLSKAKVHTEKYDVLANGTLDKLIRNGLITNEMATSLMNDSAYAYDISKNLIAMTEVTFTDRSSSVVSLNEEMAMNDDDIKEILEKKDD
ncbi:MAG: Na/Pi cotransporter family protein [Sulfurovum sp.]|uniref:Na/Pi cotransporter family protein n=1 Tax=Sulfurovum sp. TaxID=1969726 RepID=UPI0028681CD2|nr:Na/Pi symporter [Sulfurovum sp.]MCO4845461.1 Na/Pi cotransporter family protein [Sulfurovum sp.]